MLEHADIWRAIDMLAKKNGLTPSGLARKAGLSATLFNPSKRSNDGRKRWPSTESIASVLRATRTDFASFVALVHQDKIPLRKLPLLDYSKITSKPHFDGKGYPKGKDWDEFTVVCPPSDHTFAIEIDKADFEPAYRLGDRLVLSPSIKAQRGNRVILATKAGEACIGTFYRETGLKIDLISITPPNPHVSIAKDNILWMAKIMWVLQ